MVISWQGYNWITQERWGVVHPQKPICWYDEAAVEIDESGFLHLKTHLNPKEFPDLGFTSPIGVGMVSCTEKFTYGRYEIEAKLPSCKHLWPAFWMWSFDSWPPEIDVFEAYTGKKDNYFKIQFRSLLGIWNVQSNLHYGKSPNNKHIGGKTGFMGFKNPQKNFIKYRLDWREDGVEIFYNGYLVRKVKDPSIINCLKNAKMNVIINNSVDNDINIGGNVESDFIIKSFKCEKF